MPSKVCSENPGKARKAGYHGAADYKELFILFDKDMNGVLSFAELGTAMKTLVQRLPGKYHM